MSTTTIRSPYCLDPPSPEPFKPSIKSPRLSPYFIEYDDTTSSPPAPSLVQIPPVRKSRSPFCLDEDDDNEELLNSTLTKGLTLASSSSSSSRPILSSSTASSRPRSRFCIDDDDDDDDDDQGTVSSQPRSRYCVDNDETTTTTTSTQRQSPVATTATRSRYCLDENEENGVMFPESALPSPCSSSLSSSSCPSVNVPSIVVIPPPQLATIHPPKKFKPTDEGDLTPPSTPPHQQQQQEPPQLHSLASPCARTKMYIEEEDVVPFLRVIEKKAVGNLQEKSSFCVDERVFEPVEERITEPSAFVLRRGLSDSLEAVLHRVTSDNEIGSRRPGGDSVISSLHYNISSGSLCGKSGNSSGNNSSGSSSSGKLLRSNSSSFSNLLSDEHLVNKGRPSRHSPPQTIHRIPSLPRIQEKRSFYIGDAGEEEEKVKPIPEQEQDEDLITIESEPLIHSSFMQPHVPVAPATTSDPFGVGSFLHLEKVKGVVCEDSVDSPFFSAVDSADSPPLSDLKEIPLEKPNFSNKMEALYKDILHAHELMCAKTIMCSQFSIALQTLVVGALKNPQEAKEGMTLLLYCYHTSLFQFLFDWLEQMTSDEHRAAIALIRVLVSHLPTIKNLLFQMREPLTSGLRFLIACSPPTACPNTTVKKHSVESAKKLIEYNLATEADFTEPFFGPGLPDSMAFKLLRQLPDQILLDWTNYWRVSSHDMGRVWLDELDQTAKNAVEATKVVGWDMPKSISDWTDTELYYNVVGETKIDKQNKAKVAELDELFDKLREAANDVLHRSLHENIVSVPNILSMHRYFLMDEEVPREEFRRDVTVGSFAFYAQYRVFLPHQEIAEAMEHLVRSFQTVAATAHPIVQAFYLYSSLVYFIHPFEDGNGRMARLWGNMVLRMHGYSCAIRYIDKVLTFSDFIQAVLRTHSS